MKYTQTGSAARTTLITLVAIVAFLGVAIMLLPKGFSTDTSVIGQGSHVVVLAHNKEYAQSLTLMDLLNKMRSEYSSQIEFRVIDMNTPQGHAFLQQQQQVQRPIRLTPMASSTGPTEEEEGLDLDLGEMFEMFDAADKEEDFDEAIKKVKTEEESK